MDPILTNLSAYSGKYSNELIGQVFRSLDKAGITILENIKGTTKFPKLKIGRGLKPYTGNFVPSNVLDYSDRALTPEMAQFDINIDPRKYRNSFMTESIDKNSKYYGIPQENFVWAKVTEELADEIIQYIIGDGDTTSSDNASKITDGLKKKLLEIIAAGLAPITTGVTTSSNAVANFEKLYAEAMANNDAWRGKPLNLYCSYTNKDNYVVDYRSRFAQDPSIYSNTPGELFLKISEGMCKITPVSWLAGSQRLILAPKENLVLGTDKMSDLNTINTIQDVYSVKAGISFTIGLQILDDEAIWCNDMS